MQLAVVSDLPNAAATALTASSRGVSTAFEGRVLQPGDVAIDMFGEATSVRILALDDLFSSVPTVGVVFAEGQDVFQALRRLQPLNPAALVVVGGGIKAVVDVVGWAREIGLGRGRLFFTAGFVVAGNTERVWSEKRALPGAFGGSTPDHSLEALLSQVFPGVMTRTLGEVALSAVNPMLHAAPMILNAMSVERQDHIGLYRDGFGRAVARFVGALDAERLAIAAAWKLDLPDLEGLLDSFYAEEGFAGVGLQQKINEFPPYEHVLLPSSFDHRFLAHEVEGSLAPLFEIAKLLSIPSSTLGAVVRCAEILVGTDYSNPAKEVAQQFLRLV